MPDRFRIRDHRFLLPVMALLLLAPGCEGPSDPDDPCVLQPAMSSFRCENVTEAAVLRSQADLDAFMLECGLGSDPPPAPPAGQMIVLSRSDACLVAGFGCSRLRSGDLVLDYCEDRVICFDPTPSGTWAAFAAFDGDVILEPHDNCN